MLLRLVNQLRRSIGTHGLSRAVAITWFRCCERLGDGWYGIETRQMKALNQGPFCHDYEATDYRAIIAGLRLVRVMQREVVFLDYGCGKGRTLAVAATHSFRRIIGLDLHAGMLATARDNLSRMKRFVRCRDIELVNQDAMVFEVPDDVNVIFFFNPFSLPVLEVVIVRIKSSLKRAPRAITILYLHPNDEPDPFVGLDWCREINVLPVAEHLALRFPVYQTTLNQ